MVTECVSVSVYVCPSIVCPPIPLFKSVVLPSEVLTHRHRMWGTLFSLSNAMECMNPGLRTLLYRTSLLSLLTSDFRPTPLTHLRSAPLALSAVRLLSLGLCRCFSPRGPHGSFPQDHCTEVTFSEDLPRPTSPPYLFML